MNDIFNSAINNMLENDLFSIIKGIIFYGIYLITVLVLIAFWCGVGRLLLLILDKAIGVSVLL